MKRSLRILLVTFAFVYLLYVTAFILVGNSRAFQKLAGMEDREMTHVTFKAIYSLWPGIIRAKEAVVHIRDQNVNIAIVLKGVRTRLDLSKVKEKRLHFPDLRVNEVQLIVKMKTAEETDRYYREHAEAKHFKALTEGMEKELRETILKLEFPKLEVDRVSLLRFGPTEISGKIRLSGGFRLQPGVEAEVFPTLVAFEDARIDEDFKELKGEIRASFDPFAITRTFGDAVFRSLNAEVKLSGLARNLKLLNVTLQSLSGYGFDDAESNVELGVKVRKGVLQPESFFKTDRAAIAFRSPKFEVRGKGVLTWEVPKGEPCPKNREPVFNERLTCGRSVLKAHFSNADGLVTLTPTQKLKGRVKGIQAEIDLSGTDLTAPFVGLHGRVEIADSELKTLEQVPRPAHELGGGAVSQARDEPLEWSATLQAKGRLEAVTGLHAHAARIRKASKTQFFVDLKEFRLGRDEIYATRGKGSVRLSMGAFDFGKSEVKFDGLTFEVEALTKRDHAYRARFKLSDVSHGFADARGLHSFWKGKLDFRIDAFSAWLDTLAEEKKISRLLARLLETSEVKGKGEWELGDAAFFRLNELKSDGLWNVWGTYSATGPKTLGAFEGKVVGLPVGFLLKDGDFKYKLMPTQAWYRSALSDSARTGKRANVR